MIPEDAGRSLQWAAVTALRDDRHAMMAAPHEDEPEWRLGRDVEDRFHAALIVIGALAVEGLRLVRTRDYTREN